MMVLMTLTTTTAEEEIKKQVAMTTFVPFHARLLVEEFQKRKTSRYQSMEIV